MKNFTFLFAGLFLSMASFAQTHEITELWDHSIQSSAVWDDVEEEWTGGAAPEWMGGTTERGLAHFDGKLYVPSRKDGNQILVLDATSGLLIESETITLAAEEVFGGTLPINSIAVTQSGKFIISNLAANTQSVDVETELPNGMYKAYMVDPTDNNKVTKLFEWHNVGDEVYPGFRLGDGMNFYGDIADGQTGYLITGTAANRYILRWDFVNGVVADEPVIIELLDVVPAPVEGAAISLGIAPQYWPIDENSFMVDGHSTVPMVFDMTGNMLASFTGPVGPTQPGVSGGAYFEFKGKHYVVAPSTNHVGEPKNSFQAFEIVDGDFEAAVSLGVLPELGMGSVSNTSYINPVVVDVQSDQVLFYVMFANNGIAGYRLTYDPGTSIITPESNSTAVLFPSPATDVVNFSVRMTSVEIYNIAGQLVKSAADVDAVNVADLKGIYLVKGVDVHGLRLAKKLVVR